jgi:hypothetical protein
MKMRICLRCGKFYSNNLFCRNFLNVLRALLPIASMLLYFNFGFFKNQVALTG